MIGFFCPQGGATGAWVGDGGHGRNRGIHRTLPEQVAAIRDLLASTDEAVTAEELARHFSQGRRAEKKVEEVLRTLTLLGQAERSEAGYVLSD